MNGIKRLLPVTLAACLLLTGCGSESTDSSSKAADTSSQASSQTESTFTADNTSAVTEADSSETADGLILLEDYFFIIFFPFL